MNIPDEVGEQALKADDTWVFIAEWARTEALLEAAAEAEQVLYVSADGLRDATKEWGKQRITVATWLRARALVEGDN